MTSSSRSRIDGGYGEAKRLGGLEVQDHLVFHRKLHREIARLVAAQNVIDIGGANIGSRHNSTIPVICRSAQAAGETLRRPIRHRATGALGTLNNRQRLDIFLERVALSAFRCDKHAEHWESNRGT